MFKPTVYILASGHHGTLYIGVTSDLPQRVEDYQHGRGSQFTAKYGVRRLVWFEDHEDMATAIQREKSLKRYLRKWKIDLIEAINPHWHALHPETGEILHEDDYNPWDGSSGQARG